jgi:hypothetical protein
LQLRQLVECEPSIPIVATRVQVATSIIDV